MEAIKKARYVRTVFTAYVTAAAASLALGYVLVPAWAAADEANPTAGTAGMDLQSPMVLQTPSMTLPAYIDQSVIGGNVMAGASGALAVNQAAGDMNQQVNAAAIAYNPQGGASAQTGIVQSSTNTRGSLPNVAATSIEGSAFANTSGVLAVNQASGFANSQANSTAIAIGINGVVITDSVLAETVPAAGGLVKAGNEQASTREVSVSETAFQNAQGVVQLNQTAGSGNSSANSFGLRLSVEPKH